MKINPIFVPVLFRCQRWVQNTRRDDLLNRSHVYLNNNCRLCAEHFEEDQFSNRMTKNRLKWNAVPTLFNVPNPPKTLSTPRRTMKRERERSNNESPPHASKQQKSKSDLYCYESQF